ncbi:YlxR family protein [Aquihabitans daechungensis]|uniref:YlxR family protein n=1 Tax=Aquihabitans daechungensis TaxID=1052257 RepID=UPI003BA15CA3
MRRSPRSSASTRTSPPRGPTRSKIPPDLGIGPQRTCVGCQTVRPQRELVRIARTADGTLAVGRTLPGRGAWLCHGSPSCLDLAVRRGGFARSFRSPVSTSAIAELRSAMAADQQR